MKLLKIQMFPQFSAATDSKNGKSHVEKRKRKQLYLVTVMGKRSKTSKIPVDTHKTIKFKLSMHNTYYLESHLRWERIFHFIFNKTNNNFNKKKKEYFQQDETEINFHLPFKTFHLFCIDNIL
jgi:hypothetical protein